MGVVYRGFHPGLEVPVAIKVLSDEYSRDSQFRRRFQREAAAIAALNHPGIVRIYDFDEDNESLFIVMEYVEGESLRSILQNKGPLQVHQALDITGQLLSAIGAAHAHNIVHRDLKPDNVVVSNVGKVKVMDFGISKLLVGTPGLTGTESIIGTPTYMSPEQVRGEHVDARSDLYAVGCILYEVLTGNPPFTGQLAAVLHAQINCEPTESPLIPAAVMTVIRKAMAKDLRKRFKNCEEFAGALLSMDTAQMEGTSLQGPTDEAPVTESRLPFRLPSLRQKLPALKAAGGPAPADEPGRRCSDGQCRSAGRHRCSYRDRTGAECNTWWCEHHIHSIGQDSFCRRHITVIRALAVTAGTIREIKHLPAVNDRSLSLAAMVGNDLDKDITEILRRRYSSRRDVTVVADKTVRETRDGGSIAWERSWSATRNQGYETRISVWVSSQEPCRLEVRIGSMAIYSGVPDWISHRLEGKPADRADRVSFNARLVEAITEAVDRPAPLAGGYASLGDSSPGLPQLRALPEIDPNLLEGLVMRALSSRSTSVPGYEICQMLALPFGSVEPVIKKLAGERLLDPGGLDPESSDRPMPERMTYTMSAEGRLLTEEMAKKGTRYLGPAPVTLAEYVRLTTEVILPGLDPAIVRAALDGLELSPGVEDAVRAAVNSRGSVFVYGSPGNGKTSLARRFPRLLRGPVLVPAAIDLGGGEVMVVFDPAVHKLDADQPRDGRWRRVIRPLVQVGGEFTLEMLAATWDPASRTYQAPLQVKANGGVLLIDDFGRQPVKPKQILDRMMVPLEQAVDHLQLSASGRKVEVPFRSMLIFSTNMAPAELLDEGHLRRLAYKIRMPDPTPQLYRRIFERERQRLGIPANPQVFPQIGHLYGSMSIRGNHPRDLLERLLDVASARGVQPELRPELVDAAWQTLFVLA